MKKENPTKGDRLLYCQISEGSLLGGGGGYYTHTTLGRFVLLSNMGKFTWNSSRVS